MEEMKRSIKVKTTKNLEKIAYSNTLQSGVRIMFNIIVIGACSSNGTIFMLNNTNVLLESSVQTVAINLCV